MPAFLAAALPALGKLVAGTAAFGVFDHMVYNLMDKVAGAKTQEEVDAAVAEVEQAMGAEYEKLLGSGLSETEAQEQVTDAFAAKMREAQDRGGANEWLKLGTSLAAGYGIGSLGARALKKAGVTAFRGAQAGDKAEGAQKLLGKSEWLAKRGERDLASGRAAVPKGMRTQSDLPPDHAARGPFPARDVPDLDMPANPERPTAALARGDTAEPVRPYPTAAPESGLSRIAGGALQSSRNPSWQTDPALMGRSFGDVQRSIRSRTPVDAAPFPSMSPRSAAPQPLGLPPGVEQQVRMMQDMGLPRADIERYLEGLS